ncbi:hypothetical protein GR160_13060 [Flavobacterium sp. Sd200]|uniref:hypothetical protein n=1 Tax=Flavobacterium sp. Sd200 TaxID=2692211 RepID=UPI001367E8C3|nr:hypothetical protein [Flavobacterium sp. Sd200]MXN92157.1 hypothetical protein [Flavobacterium sp. Sd200]
MKHFITVFILFFLFTNCKKDVIERSKVNINNKDASEKLTNIVAEIKESNAEEFEKGSYSALSGFSTDLLRPDTLLLPPVVINTQKKKLAFHNINPYLQKGYYDEEEVTYTYLGYSKEVGKYLLSAQYYEGGSYFLVDQVTAKIDTLAGMPDFSPNRQKIISYYVNPYGGGKSLLSADIQILSLSNSKFTCVFNENLDYIPDDIKWKGNNIVLIKALSADEFYEIQTDTVNKKQGNYIYKKIILK